LFVYSNSDPDTAYTGIEACIREHCINGNAKSYITIDGLVLKHAYHVAFVTQALGSSEATDYGIIQNCTITNCGDWNFDDYEDDDVQPVGIYLGCFADNWTITNNTIGPIYSDSTKVRGEGVYIGKTYSGGSRNSDNCTVSHNTIYDVYQGITLKYDSKNNIVEHNTIYTCKYGGIVSIGGTSGGNTIRYNTIYDVDDSGTSGIEIYTQNTIYYNIIYDCYNGIFVNPVSGADENSHTAGDDNYIYNNTLVDNEYPIVFNNDDAPTCVDNIVKNNIIAEVTESACVRMLVFYDKDDIPNNTINYNCYYDIGAEDFRVVDNGGANPGHLTFAEWQSIYSQDAQSINTDPLFVDAENADFTLQSSSPCINAGTDVGLTQDYAGNNVSGTPDIGAYEKTSDEFISFIYNKLPTTYIMGSSVQSDKDDEIDDILTDSGTTIPNQISGLNNFDPDNDTVAHVTLVDTTTTNTDMRGTDGANTVIPDAAGTAAALHATTDGLIGALKDITVAEIRNDVCESTNSYKDYMRLFASVMFGKASGGNTTNIKFRDIADTKNRIDETVDAYGNGTSVTLDPD